MICFNGLMFSLSFLPVVIGVCFIFVGSRRCWGHYCDLLSLSFSLGFWLGSSHVEVLLGALQSIRSWRRAALACLKEGEGKERGCCLVERKEGFEWTGMGGGSTAFSSNFWTVVLCFLVVVIFLLRYSVS